MNKRHLISYVFCLLAIFILPVSVYATTIFGPQDFAAGWFGVHHSSHSFSADAAVKGQLHVTKSSDATFRTGFLLINGKRVSLHNFLRGSEIDFAKEINLKKNNTILIFFVARKGAFLSVSIGQGPAAPPSEITFNAGPSDILLGESSTLEWSTKDADNVSISPGIGTVNPSGNVSVTPATTTEYTLTATGPGGVTEARTTVSVTIPAPTVTLHAAPSTIAPGETSTLSWSTTNADTCTIAPDVGAIACSGSTSVTPTATTDYTITATGPGGVTEARTTVSVTIPAPTVTLHAAPSTIAPGETSTLNWSSTNADTCTIAPDVGAIACSGSISVTPSATTGYTVTAIGPGGTTTADVTITVGEPQPTVVISASPASIVLGGSTLLSWDSKKVTSVHIDNGIGSVTLTGSQSVSPTATTTYTITGTGAEGTVSSTVTVQVAGNPEPQPEGSFGAQYNELVPGDATIETYDEKRFSLVTGKVQDKTGQPLAGVAVTIHGHSEYGTTATGDDGSFTLPVEGGGLLTVVCKKEGYITSHRQVNVGWNDYGIVEPIRLLPVDPAATEVVFNGNPATVITHTATEVTDSFGSRAATMVFTGDNSAFLLDEQGNDVQTLKNVTVRATEYATPESMPAKLPPNSAYTYCSELQVDGAERVRFAKPVPLWVDNFLGFEVGEIVPVGYYDRDKAQWVPSDNGIVVRLLDTDNDGLVDALDSTGDGLPDDLNNSGSLNDEVIGLTDSSRYQPYATFWRAEVNHFSPRDLNWPADPPPHAVPPNGPTPDPNPGNPPDDSCTPTNSYVKHKTQVFHEDIPISGTDLTLHYASNRVKGYKHVINIPASGDTVPPALKYIVVRLEIAGRIFEEMLPAEANQGAEFVWDGKDHLGNYVEKGAIGMASIGYAYDMFYSRPGNFNRAFAQAGTESTGIPARDIFINWKRSPVTIDAYGGEQVVGNGWSISNHHRLLQSVLMQRGDGINENITNNGKIIDTIAGNGIVGYRGDNGTALEAEFNNAWDIFVDRSGDMYIADMDNNRVRRIDRDGIVTTIAGNGTAGYTGDNGLATAASLNNPSSVAVDSIGNIYIGDTENHRVRKIDSNGIISTVAGNGTLGFSGDGGPASMAQISYPYGLAIDKNDDIYFTDSQNKRIRKIDASGIVTTVAGNGTYNYGNGGLAIESGIGYAQHLTIDNSGNIYIPIDSLVLKVDTSGIITRIAGGESWGFTGDGGLATEAELDWVTDVAIDRAGYIYIADNGNNRIRVINTEGIINTFAGFGSFEYSGDGGPPLLAGFSSIFGIGTDSDGNVYTLSNFNTRIRKISTSALVQSLNLDQDSFLIVGKDERGNVFDTAGRHLFTIDPHSGKTLTSFNYNDEHRLVAITDRFDNVITIERDGSGKPTSIISPYGHRTNLTVDGENNLTGIDFEGGTGYSFGYTSDGLMTSMTNPRGLISTHSFDDTGRVISTEDPEHGIWTLDKLLFTDGAVQSSITSSENNTISHLDTIEPGGVYKSVTTNPSGDTSTFTRKNQNLDDSKESCGMSTDIRYTLDKKSKRKTPQTVSISSPAGLTSQLDLDQNYVEDAEGLTQTSTATLKLNGKTVTEITDYLAGTATSTSPTGRKAISTFDRSTLLISDTEFGGLLPTHFTYDTHGRLTAATTGARNISYGYDPRGNLTSVVDPLNRTTYYSYDLLDRPTRIDRPDNSTVRFQYDESGNLTVLTTPVPADNHFAYNGVNRVSGFTTPLGSITSYVYDKERKLTAINLPSGKKINNTYTHGRLSETTTAEWTNSYTYNCGDQPASISRGSEQLGFGYDGTLLTSITQSGTVSGNIGFTYNNDLNLTSFSYAGATESYAYDNDGLLTTAGKFTIARRADNGLAEKVSSDSLVLNRSFNAYGEIEAIDVAVSGSAIFGYDLTRDNSGRITSKTETVNGTQSRFSYTYDDLGRLLTVTLDGTLVEDYHYDANGNRISETNSRRGITNRTLTHSTEDHIITAGTIKYEFDLDDKLAARIDGSQTTEYSYSSTGELLSVKLPDTRVVGYINDPLGRRIAKKINGVVVEKYLWSGLTALLAVYDGSDTLLQRFEYADGQLPSAMKAGSSTYYLSYDQVGSLRLVADSSGNIVKQIDYDTFGNIVSDSNPAFTVPFGFAGGFHDRDTDLVRFGYRDYLPEIGKWTAKDPILFAGGDSNLYGYVLNDPINWIDPWGLFFYNPGNTPITVKPEHGPPTTVKPGGFYPDQIDGFKPPAYNGDWYKVPDYTNGSITPWGTPIEWGSGNLIPDFPDLGPLTDRLPGRKGPGFEDRFPDWKDPNECK